MPSTLRAAAGTCGRLVMAVAVLAATMVVVLADRAVAQRRNDPKPADRWMRLAAQPENASIDGRYVMLVPGNHTHFIVKFESKNRAPNRPHSAELYGCKDEKCTITICNEQVTGVTTHSFYGSRCKDQPPLSLEVMFAASSPERWKTSDVYLVWPDRARSGESVALSDTIVQVGVLPDLFMTSPELDPAAKRLYAKWTVEPAQGANKTPQLYLLISPSAFGPVAPAGAPVAGNTSSQSTTTGDSRAAAGSGTAGTGAAATGQTATTTQQAASSQPAPPAKSSVLVEISGFRKQDVAGEERQAALLKCLAQASDFQPQVDVHFQSERSLVLQFSYSARSAPTIFSERVACVATSSCSKSSAERAVRLSLMELVNETGEANQKIEDMLKIEMKRLNGVSCRTDSAGKRQMALVPTGTGAPRLDLPAWTQQGYELKHRHSQQSVVTASFVEGLTLDVALHKRQSQKFRIVLSPAQGEVTAQILAELIGSKQVTLYRQDSSVAISAPPRLVGNQLVLADDLELKPEERITLSLPPDVFGAGRVPFTTPPGLRITISEIGIPISVIGWMVQPVELFLSPVQQVYGREEPLRAVTARDCQYTIALPPDRRLTGRLTYTPGAGGTLAISQKNLPLKGLEARNLRVTDASIEFAPGRDDNGGACPAGKWPLKDVAFDTNSSRLTGKVIVPGTKPALLGLVAPRASPPQHWDSQSRFAEAVRTVWETVIGAVAEVYEVRGARLAGGDILSVDGDTEDRRGIELLKTYFVSGGILTGERPQELRPTEDRLNKLRAVNTRTTVRPENFTDVITAYRANAADQLVVVGLAVAPTDSSTCGLWRDALTRSAAGVAAVMVLIDDRQQPQSEIRLTPCAAKDQVQILSLSIERLKVASTSSVEASLKSALKQHIEALLPR